MRDILDNVLIRKAEPSDAKMLKQIARRVILKRYPAFLGHDSVRSFVESGASDNEIDSGLACSFILCQKENIAGFVIIKADLLHILMIDIEYQKKGFGTQLLKHAENLMFECYSSLRLQTFKENYAAVEFYIKNGWQIKEMESIDGPAMLKFEKNKQ